VESLFVDVEAEMGEGEAFGGEEKGSPDEPCEPFVAVVCSMGLASESKLMRSEGGVPEGGEKVESAREPEEALALADGLTPCRDATVLAVRSGLAWWLEAA